ncbi:phage holin family protein [Lacticaseibacillus parakribbianus]|uniref:phage holin family protein n=1 Tax=Lacticaseibacillus parakribbianus TaxID=2970927 RepID=UPI0021CB1149|nr:phage holin family protein [Lacticaseibacillus parakribbianus]
MTKINWKARVQNPVWWVQIVLAIFLPVLAYFGLDGKDMSTWKAFFDLLWRAFSNPYVVAMMLGSAWSAINDPTTAGVSDSMQALGYTAPKKEDK